VMEVGVQPDIAGVLYEFDQILARGWVRRRRNGSAKRQFSESSVRTFFHSSVVNSLLPRSSSTGLELIGDCRDSDASDAAVTAQRSL